MSNDRARISKSFKDFVGSPDNYSGRVNTIIGRYKAMVEENMPELSVNEWCAICDANNGTHMLADFNENDPARWAWMNVADSEPSEMKEKWALDNLELARKMKSMSFIEQCAVMEVIQKFWENSGQQYANYTEMLTAAGAKIAG
jgi:hypothetical protein